MYIMPNTELILCYPSDTQRDTHTCVNRQSHAQKIIVAVLPNRNYDLTKSFKCRHDRPVQDQNSNQAILFIVA